MTAPAEVFISYRHADAAAATQLFELLRDRGIAAWYDALMPGAPDFRDAIVGQLSRASVMAILISKAALESDELKKELAVAVQEKVPVLTVRLENVKPRAAFAYELARGNWFDVFPDPPARLAELADLLARMVRDSKEIPKILEASIDARIERQRRDAWGRWNFLRRPTPLAALVLVATIIAIGLYEVRANPIEHLVSDSGLSPLVAYAYVTVAVTVASPLLILQRLRGMEAADLPLLAVSATNASLLWLLARAMIREVRLRLRQMLVK